jgi:NADH-quinone oxidoreductase subunit M
MFTFALLAEFDPKGGFQFGGNYPWVQSLGLSFNYGLDGISILLILLTNFLTPLIILTSFNHNYHERTNRFYGLLLLMCAGLNGVFMALDGLLFYIFWEITLIPIWFICATWGGEDRLKITLKFFIYTFAGSLLMLVALIYLYLQTPGAHSFDIQALYDVALSPESQNWVFWFLFIGFAIKMPVWPFHTWQPDTYTNAPTTGTMLLSGIMLKMGIYGMIRWLLPMVPEAIDGSLSIAIGLAITGIVYAAIIAIKQQDLKRIIAYSSISHVGLIAAGVMSLNTQGMQGGIIQMLNHGINVVGLFFIIDIIEKRTKTRLLDSLGGIAHKAPKLAILFMIVMLGSVAVPLTNGFVGEFLLLSGVYQFGAAAALIAGLTIIFCAVYMLRVYQFTMFGEINSVTAEFEDVKGRELWILAVISGCILILGVYPQPIFDIAQPSVENLLKLCGK